MQDHRVVVVVICSFELVVDDVCIAGKTKGQARGTLFSCSKFDQKNHSLILFSINLHKHNHEITFQNYFLTMHVALT